MASATSAPPTVSIAPEERNLAAVTHLSGLAGYLIPLGGVLVPIIIWMVKSDSRVISTIAKQAVLLNIVAWVAAGVLFLLCFTVILIPVSILGGLALFLAALALPIIGAVKASSGTYYRYPVVGLHVD
jgi:uncharacterized Tic20 family protein